MSSSKDGNNYFPNNSLHKSRKKKKKKQKKNHDVDDDDDDQPQQEQQKEQGRRNDPQQQQHQQQQDHQYQYQQQQLQQERQYHHRHDDDRVVHVKVVLLCSGRGGDRTSFRPNADESQWWGRRDALVRCVTSFLFGPTTTTTSAGTATAAAAGKMTMISRELVLVFDDDLARIHMRRVHSSSTAANSDTDTDIDHHHHDDDVPPTEHTIIQLWKKAAQQLQQPVIGNGIHCTTYLDPYDSTIVGRATTATAAAETKRDVVSSSNLSSYSSQKEKNHHHHQNQVRGNNNNNSSNNNNKTKKLGDTNQQYRNQYRTLPVGMDTKRHVLEYLQKHCSIDFLRNKGLNSTSDVILRKTNRKALIQIWYEWLNKKEEEELDQQQQEMEEDHNVDDGDDDDKVRRDQAVPGQGGEGDDHLATQHQKQRNHHHRRHRQRFDDRLATIYRDLLQPSQHITIPSNIENITTVVGTLHETGQEFPCFQRHSPAFFQNAEKGYGSNEGEAQVQQQQQLEQQHPQILHVCLFLGAVRDMTAHENKLLEKVCYRHLNDNEDAVVITTTRTVIPLLAIRFGTVPEFTSKILSLLAFHHANGVIGPSIHRLLLLQQQLQLSTVLASASPVFNRRNDNPGTTTTLKDTHLSVVCIVPISSHGVSIDLARRDRIHWSLLRIIVCTLWRSKVASKSCSNNNHNNNNNSNKTFSSSPTPTTMIRHTNSLQLIFEDGVVVHLDEAQFVNKLASQHQSAPSEYQILAALIQALDGVVGSTKSATKGDTRTVRTDDAFTGTGDGSKQRWMTDIAKQVIHRVVQSSSSILVPVTCAIGLNDDAPTSAVTPRFYGYHPPLNVQNDTGDSRSDRGVMLIMDIHSNKNGGKSDNQQQLRTRRILYHELLSASRSMGIPTIEDSIVVGKAEDREAASIVALQHFCYQNRVFGTTAAAAAVSSTRKRKNEEEVDVVVAGMNESSLPLQQQLDEAQQLQQPKQKQKGGSMNKKKRRRVKVNEQ